MEEANFLSSFLEPLGSAIINSFWQIGFLWIIASIINSTFKLSSGNRYKLALLFQVTGFVWFIQSIYSFPPALYFQNIVVSVQHVLHVSHVKSAFTQQLSIILIVSASAYLITLLYKVVLFLIGIKHIGVIRNKGLQKIDVEWRLFLRKACSTLSIKKQVKICISDLVSSPLTVGFLKPLILIPAACINQLSIQQMEAIILHEAAHIKRFDYLVNMMQRVVDLMLFFNPFNRMLSQMVSLEREHSCDDLVLQFKYNAIEYADALFKIARTAYNPKLIIGFAGNDEGQLLKRVRRMVKPNRQQSVLQYVVPVFFVFILMAGLVKFNGLIFFPTKENFKPGAWKQNVSLMDHYFLRSNEMGMFQSKPEKLLDKVYNANKIPVAQVPAISEKNIEDQRVPSSSAKNTVTAALPLKKKAGKSQEIEMVLGEHYSQPTAVPGDIVLEEITSKVPATFVQKTITPVSLTNQINENLNSLFTHTEISNPVINFEDNGNNDAIFNEDETVVSMIVNEEKSSSYRKKIIVTTIDGNMHSRSFTITVEFYQ